MSNQGRELGPKDIIFPIVGPTGAGKSTFINIALGQDVTEVGHGTTSCTKHPVPIFIDPIPTSPKAVLPVTIESALRGYRLVLLDTPGLLDTPERDVGILKHVSEWLEASHRKGALIGGVLYFHDISTKRFTGTERQNLHIFSRLCGYDPMAQPVLVTTNWPLDHNAVLEQREEELKGGHWKTLIEKGLDVRRFQANRPSAWVIIDLLLRRIPNIIQRNDADHRLDLEIQIVLIRLRMAIPETEAGQELRYTLRKILKLKKEADALEQSFARIGDREARRDWKIYG